MITFANGKNHGVLRDSAEIIPIEPDAGNADAGIYDITIGYANFIDRHIHEEAPILWQLPRLGAFYFSNCFHQKHFREILYVITKKKCFMKVNINNKQTETQALNVKQLAEELNLPAKGVAIAISNSMVPRNVWEQTPITEGADIVIIKAFCGG